MVRVIQTAGMEMLAGLVGPVVEEIDPDEIERNRRLSAAENRKLAELDRGFAKLARPRRRKRKPRPQPRRFQG